MLHLLLRGFICLSLWVYLRLLLGDSRRPPNRDFHRLLRGDFLRLMLRESTCLLLGDFFISP